MGAKAKRQDGAVRGVSWSVRFTPDECDLVREKAYKAHASISEYIRRVALGRKVVSPPPPPAVNIQTYKELARIGTNFNYLVTAVNRAVNMGQGVNVDVEALEKLVQQMTGTIKEVQLQLLSVSTSTGGEESDREADNQ